MLSHFTGDESSCPAKVWIYRALEPKAKVILGAVDIVREPHGAMPELCVAFISDALESARVEFVQKALL